MTIESRHSTVSMLAIGAIAGLAGTVVLMSARAFDTRYAPKTVPTIREDPGLFLLQRTERATGLEGKVPGSLNRACTLLMHLGYGASAGALYAAIRRRRQNVSTLSHGGLIGTALYAVGYIGWLPLLRLTRPPSTQPFPEIAGEVLRQVVYGVVTAEVYGAISSRI